MNAARLLREVTRSPLWRYDDDDRLVLIVPPGAHAMHRHVTKDACNMRWTDSVRFSRAMPAIVPSPDGIYIAPFIEVALRHTMREYDPRIIVAKIDEDAFRKTALAAYSSSTRYDRVNRDYGNEVILPDAARAYRVYNVAGSRKPPSCMTKPMKIHTKVERNVEYESRPLFTDPPDDSAKFPNTLTEKTTGLLLRARDVSKRKVDVSVDSEFLKKSRIPRGIGNIASNFAQMASNAYDALDKVVSDGAAAVTKPIRAVVSQPTRRTSKTDDEYVDVLDGMTGMEAMLYGSAKSPDETVVACPAGGGCADMEVEE